MAFAELRRRLQKANLVAVPPPLHLKQRQDAQIRSRLLRCTSNEKTSVCSSDDAPVAFTIAQGA